MEEIVGFLSVVIILVLFSGTLVFGVLTSIVNPVKKTIQTYTPLSSRLRRILVENFPYYRKLNNQQQKEFEKRLKYFIAHKDFIPRNMSRITDEMKVLIGACAVQITFGFKPLKLAHFKKIVVYPHKYHSKISGKSHRGEVNPRGAIVLSWEDFIKGYRVPYDGINLGLHEMAHALKLSDAIQDEEYAFIEDKSLFHWHKVSTREIRRIKRGKKTFLRKYAAIDQEEFFAVCTEEFFEQPYRFRRDLPEVYHALARLLNQDPIEFYRSPLEEDLEVELREKARARVQARERACTHARLKTKNHRPAAKKKQAERKKKTNNKSGTKS